MANDDLRQSITILHGKIIQKKQLLQNNINNQTETSRQHLIALYQKEAERKDQIRYVQLCNTCDSLMLRLEKLADEMRDLRVTIRNLEGFYELLATSQ